ncbi:hypothetical protein [Luteolibacter marinus]|uniref:hypothetical protein n=1 Tax=Luteolibacter marinus TaxID=2776705 RepID=UPI0018684EDE|nr:hypothetical protein [Luteolibacter marinus]
MNFIDRCRDRWADLHPLWRTLAVLGVLAGLAYAAFGPALGVYRHWRTDRRLADSRKALEMQNFAEARELSLQVLRSDGSRQEAIPVLLRAAHALGDPRRAEVAVGILAASGFPPDDRKLAWQIVCRSCSTWYVRAVWPGLQDAERADPEFVAPLVDRLLRDGMPTDAALLLRQHPQPLPPELDLRLMKILIAKGSDEAYQEFQKTLIGRLASAPGDAEAWVGLIDELPQSSLLPGTYAPLAAWQATRGEPDPAAALRLARCEMAAAPDRADEIFQATLARFGGSAPLATARWCLRTRHLDAADRLLAALPAGEEIEAFDLRRQLFEQADRLEDWENLLEDPPSLAFLPEIHCDQAYIAARRKDRDARDIAEAAALRTAKEATADDALIRLARHAEQRGLDAFAQRAWVEAIRRGNGPIPPATRLKGVIEKLALDKKESELLEVLTAYRFIEPGNPVIIVQHDYLSCLNGRITPDNLIRDLDPIHEKLPDALPVRCVLALGHLLNDNADKALELTAGSDIDWFAASPAYRAIRGITLAANDRKEEAGVFLEDFPWDELLPAERKTLKGLADTRTES